MNEQHEAMRRRSVTRWKIAAVSAGVLGAGLVASGNPGLEAVGALAILAAFALVVVARVRQ